MQLEPNGALKLMPAEYYDSLDWMELRTWCHFQARYGLPTVELIAWLKDYIGDRKAIEIGAGSGDLCHHLGIVGTDNFQQTWPQVAMYYAIGGQPTIAYGSWVEKIDAIAAAKKYKPDIIIGSWITHWIDPDKAMPVGGGNMFGVKEDELLKLVDTYIMIGNLDIHAHKPILELPHETLEFSFVKSRAQKRELNRIFIWRGGK